MMDPEAPPPRPPTQALPSPRGAAASVTQTLPSPRGAGASVTQTLPSPRPPSLDPSLKAPLRPPSQPSPGPAKDLKAAAGGPKPSSQARDSLVARAHKYVCTCGPQAAVQFTMAVPAVALPAMLQDAELKLPGGGFAASFVAYGSAANAFGKVMTGPVVDYIGGAAYLMVALPLMALCAAAISVGHSKGVLVAAYVGMTLCMSGAWAAESKLVDRLFREPAWPTAFAAMAGAGRLASVMARVVGGAMLRTQTWRQVCVLGAGTVGSALFLLGPLLAREWAAKYDSTAKLALMESKGEPARHSACSMLADPALLLRCGTLVGATAACGLENMVALMLVETTGCGVGYANMLSASLPAGLLIGTSLLSHVIKDMPASRRLRFEVWMQLLGLGTVGALTVLCSPVLRAVAMELLGPLHFALALSALTVVMAVAFSLTYYVTPSLFCLEAYSQDSATAMSILNSVGMLGSLAFQSAASAIFDSGGQWDSVLKLLAGACAGTVVCQLLLERRHRQTADTPKNRFRART